MTTVRKLHEKAMEYAHRAMIARDTGNFDDAISQAEIALDFEQQAAKLVPDGEKAEPTRSILYRGAASLALQCNRYSDAIKLAGIGLSGSPSPKIERDLISILEQVKFAIFLQEQGESLDDGELLFTLQGDAVGAGVVLYREFKDRIDFAIRLVNKTVQRLMNREYQAGGRIANEYKIFEQAIAVPVSQNSFSMSLRLVRREDEYQTSLFVQDAQQVIDEIIYGVELVNNNQVEELRNHINDAQYFANFVYLVSAIAPDGEKVSSVALSSANGIASLTRSSQDISLTIVEQPEEEKTKEYVNIEIEGVLKYADDEFRTTDTFVGIKTEKGERRVIKPSAGVDELVEQYWNRRVRIVGKTDGEIIYANRIIPLDDE